MGEGVWNLYTAGAVDRAALSLRFLTGWNQGGGWTRGGKSDMSHFEHGRGEKVLPR